MEEYSNELELYLRLKPAFSVKLRLLGKTKDYSYIKVEDIWNYLKVNKWKKSYGLTLADMVNDIIHVDEVLIDKYLKDKLKNEEKVLIIESGERL